MRINPLNVFFAVGITALLSWILWILGNDPTHKWLLSCIGGFVIAAGLICAMAFSYTNVRSGIQAKIIFLLQSAIAFFASVVYSFFNFSPESYCIPIGILFLTCMYVGIRILKTNE